MNLLDKTTEGPIYSTLQGVVDFVAFPAVLPQTAAKAASRGGATTGLPTDPSLIGIFVGQVPFSLPPGYLAWFVNQLVGEDCVLEALMARNQSCGRIVLPMERAQALLLLSETALFDSTGVWIARTPEQLAHLTQFCASLGQGQFGSQMLRHALPKKCAVLRLQHQPRHANVRSHRSRRQQKSEPAREESPVTSPDSLDGNSSLLFVPPPPLNTSALPHAFVFSSHPLPTDYSITPPSPPHLLPGRGGDAFGPAPTSMQLPQYHYPTPTPAHHHHHQLHHHPQHQAPTAVYTVSDSYLLPPPLTVLSSHQLEQVPWYPTAMLPSQTFVFSQQQGGMVGVNSLPQAAQAPSSPPPPPPAFFPLSPASSMPGPHHRHHNPSNIQQQLQQPFLPAPYYQHVYQHHQHATM